MNELKSHGCVIMYNSGFQNVGRAFPRHQADSRSWGNAFSQHKCFFLLFFYILEFLTEDVMAKMKYGL